MFLLMSTQPPQGDSWASAVTRAQLCHLSALCSHVQCPCTQKHQCGCQMREHGHKRAGRRGQGENVKDQERGRPSLPQKGPGPYVSNKTVSEEGQSPFLLSILPQYLICKRMLATTETCVRTPSQSEAVGNPCRVLCIQCSEPT